SGDTRNSPRVCRAATGWRRSSAASPSTTGSRPDRPAEDALVDRKQPSRNDRPVVLAREGLALGAQPIAFSGVAGELLDGGRQRVRIPGRRQPRAGTSFDECCVAVDPACNYGPARRHRLQEDDAEAFAAEGRRTDDVRGLEERGKLALGDRP